MVKYYIDFDPISTNQDENDEMMVRRQYTTEKSPYTREDVITGYNDKPIITKSEFIECYNRWIKSDEENNK